MPSMQESLIESLIKDLESIEGLSDEKVQRKELSLIIQRIDSAKKLVQGHESLMKKVLECEIKALNLKTKITKKR